MDLGNFFQVPVNYIAVLVCAMTSMVIGFLWYGPLFGKQWMNLVGLTPEKMKKEKKDMTGTYIIMFINSLLIAYVLFHFIWYAAPANYTLFISIKTSVWAWLGFVFPISLTRHLFSPGKKPLKLLFIDTGFFLASLIAMATVIFLLK